jgi:hypothetical protein
LQIGGRVRWHPDHGGEQMSGATHKCPAPECDIAVPLERLACRRDWSRLPLEIRAEIWRAYRAGEAVNHRHATAEAISWFKGNPRARV